MIFQELPSQFLNNLSSILFIQALCIFFLSVFFYIHIILKLFRLICYSRMTFEWFPLINPYKWPFSWFETFTQWYFNFWFNLFPNIRFEKSSADISSIIALEALNSILYFCVRISQSLMNFLEVIEKEIESNSFS
jgi:hypothetical protein